MILGPRQRPEPDLLVVQADAETGPDQTAYLPDAVELVVEVVSSDSEERDRERKPQLYAKAGIYHDRVKLTIPFEIDLDLTEIDQL